MNIFPRPKGPLGDDAVNRTADDALLKRRPRARKLQLGHALAKLGQQDLLLGHAVVGLRVLRVLHAGRVAGEKIALALHDPKFLLQDRLFGFDLGSAPGAFLIGRHHRLLNGGLDLRHHLPTRHPIAALNHHARQNAGDGTAQLHRQGGLHDAIKGGRTGRASKERSGGHDDKTATEWSAGKTPYKRKKSHEDRPLIQPPKTAARIGRNPAPAQGT